MAYLYSYYYCEKVDLLCILVWGLLHIVKA